MILRTRRMQCHQLGRKNAGQRPINLRSMSGNDGTKSFLTLKFSLQTGAIYKLKALLTTRPTNFVEMTKKLARGPMMN